MNGIDFAEIVEYIKLCPWQDDTSIESVIFQAKKAFEEMVEGKTKSKKTYRVCGQTGSGKSTQYPTLIKPDISSLLFFVLNLLSNSTNTMS